MRRKRPFRQAAWLLVFFAGTSHSAQETPGTGDALNGFRARIAGTPIGEKLEVTLIGGEQVHGPLAEVEGKSFRLWVEPDEATRKQLHLTSGKVKREIRYDEVAALRGGRDVASSGEELAFRLRVGDSVRIHTPEGKEFRGKVESCNGDLLQVGAQSFHLSRGQVERIEREVNDSVLNGALIGLGVGAGWVGLVCATGDCDGPAAAVAALIFGGGGAGLGALFDALNTTSETVYVSTGASEGKRLGLAPLLTPDKVGVVVSLQF